MAWSSGMPKTFFFPVVVVEIEEDVNVVVVEWVGCCRDVKRMVLLLFIQWRVWIHEEDLAKIRMLLTTVGESISWVAKRRRRKSMKVGEEVDGVVVDKARAAADEKGSHSKKKEG